MNTKLTYMYRDAANYKTNHAIILAGQITESQQKAIREHGDDSSGEQDAVFFIPSAIGLKDLQAELGNGEWDEGIDHVYHTIEEFESTEDAPTVGISSEEFVRRFIAADWEAEVPKALFSHEAG